MAAGVEGTFLIIGVVAGIFFAVALIRFGFEEVSKILKWKPKNIIRCEHEWVEKTSWRVYGLTRSNDHIDVELMCRKCGKKKTIHIYETEVL